MNDEEMQKYKEYQKNYQKMYREKKKQELENIKRGQGNFDKNAVLTPSKYYVCYINILHKPLFFINITTINLFFYYYISFFLLPSLVITSTTLIIF